MVKEMVGRRINDGTIFYLNRGYRGFVDLSFQRAVVHRKVERAERKAGKGVKGAKRMSSDNVNHPPHYRGHPSGVECIQITEHFNFCLGNALKYIWRADLKHDAIEDLQKAVWYLQREIERRTKF